MSTGPPAGIDQPSRRIAGLVPSSMRIVSLAVPLVTARSPTGSDSRPFLRKTASAAGVIGTAASRPRLSSTFRVAPVSRRTRTDLPSALRASRSQWPSRLRGTESTGTSSAAAGMSSCLPLQPASTAQSKKPVAVARSFASLGSVVMRYCRMVVRNHHIQTACTPRHIFLMIRYRRAGHDTRQTNARHSPRPLTPSCENKSQLAMNSAATSGPITNPLMPKAPSRRASK